MYKISVYKTNLPPNNDVRSEKTEWYTKEPLAASEINDYLTRSFTIQISPITIPKNERTLLTDHMGWTP